MKIYPSLFAADLTRLQEIILTLDTKGCMGYHIDIMDNHFVPNLALCQKHVADIRPLTKGFLDVHIMVTHPDKYIDSLADAGADGITIHVESYKTYITSTTKKHNEHKISIITKLLEKIKKKGIQAGIVCNPETPIEEVFPYLGLVDRVLLMTVHPGYSGQKLITNVLEKIPLLLPHLYPGCQCEVDGGVTYKHLPLLKKMRITEVVMGSAVFSKNGIRREPIE